MFRSKVFEPTLSGALLHDPITVVLLSKYKFVILGIPTIDLHRVRVLRFLPLCITWYTICLISTFLHHVPVPSTVSTSFQKSAIALDVTEPLAEPALRSVP